MWGAATKDIGRCLYRWNDRHETSRIAHGLCGWDSTVYRIFFPCYPQI